jgi:hypothetical protein
MSLPQEYKNKSDLPDGINFIYAEVGAKYCLNFYLGRENVYSFICLFVKSLNE